MSSLVYARQAPPAAWQRTSNQAQAATAPRAMPAADEDGSAPQPQDRLGCETSTSWSPASPSFASSDLLSTTFCDALDEAAALSDTMHRAAASSYAQQQHQQQHHHINSSSSNNSTASDNTNALKTEPFVTTANYELDRDMMGMLATNWTLSAGPPRAPVANWGFEPTPAEAQALYDPDALLASGNQQQTALSGSMMMAPPASTEMTHLVGMTVEPGFVSSSAPNMQQGEGAPTDPFSGMDGGFTMPYQDCATLPVGDFPLYDAGGMYKPAMNTAGLNPFGPTVVDNQLGESSIPFFGGNGAVMGVGPMYHGGTMNNNSATPLFNEVAQPPPASMAAINGGFAMPNLSLQEDDDSDWNGSSSGFSTVSSSPVANGGLQRGSPPSSSTPTSAKAPPASSRNTMNKDGSKKPKRIRRLCAVAGCGKRARSQDLCIAHGGGRRCMVEGCEKSSQGGNMCIKHGGGKRCKHPGCDKAAQTNSLCKAHGGGPRCQYPGCNKSSQGGGFCRAHGGGKRCAAEGCNKGTQRGNFCALHGGSRFCEVPGCMRNDRGGGFCAHHGGGKRCNIANCNRSCRRNGLCSTHLRLLGHETGGTVSNGAPAAISTAMPASTGVTSV